MKTGIVICSRLDSSRVPRKALYSLAGRPALSHLCQRLSNTALPIIVAVPYEQKAEYERTAWRVPGVEIHLIAGSAEDPMERMYGAAVQYGLDAIIRVNHDKIFVDADTIALAVRTFEAKNLDYLYSSQFTAGSSFEVISRRALEEAAQKFKNVEHISYAIKAVTKNVYDMPVPADLRSPYRLLLDYPEDITLLELILSQCGSDCSLYDAIDFMDTYPWAARINRQPKLTIYTCAHNDERYIQKCIGSVTSQRGFRDFEYILVDDASTDSTPLLMAKTASIYENVKWIRNVENIGLASSSNIALKHARGRYIMRLDGDDYLAPNPDVLLDLMREMDATGHDAVYPNNFFGSFKKIQDGREQHHVGGAIFRTAALNHLKFTDALRHYDGLDLFVRAKDQLKVGYYGTPTFFYRQRSGSMSKSDLVQREIVRDRIIGGIDTGLLG